jgi:thiosulfate/3-mercaptopyruvate sulfurtransferase
MESDRATLGKFVAGLAGLVLIVDTWQPWYALRVPSSMLNAADSFANQLGPLSSYLHAAFDQLRQSGPIALTAHDVFRAIDIELVVLGVAALAVVMLGIARSRALFTDGDGVALAVIGTLVTGLVGYRIVHPPGPADLLSLRPGIWVALFCGVAMVGGGLLARERSEPQGGSGRSNARPPNGPGRRRRPDPPGAPPDLEMTSARLAGLPIPPKPDRISGGRVLSEYANEVLVDTAWVEEHLNDDAIRIVEVDENPALYAEAHIPGAIGFDWRNDLQDQVKRDFLGPEAFGALLGSRGISNDHTVVLYGDRNNWFAAYTYWYLKYYGHHAVLLVNGPREKWIAEERPTSAELPSHPATTFTAKAGDLAIRAFRDEVLGAIDTPTKLVDVRSPAEFSGELISPPGYEQEGAQRAGHIPTAASVPWASAVREDGTFKSREELEALYTDKGVLNGEPIIAYCRIGERSAHTWFVLHELLGRDDVKNYDGSWTEWGNLVNVPIEKDV